MEERTRALNRHHDARIKSKRTRYVDNWTEATRAIRVPTAKEIGRKACTPCNCSCYMCGNPRKFTGELTLEEQIWVETELAWITHGKSSSYFPDDSEPRNYQNTEPHKWREAEEEIGRG